MDLIRTIARPLLASIFISGGIDSLLNPAPKAPLVDKVLPEDPDDLPALADQDPEMLVRLNGAVQMLAGIALSLGRLPRLSAAALAGTLVPTTLAGHAFWESDAADRKGQRIHFFKNLGLLGGLLIAAVDTAGRPGIRWRARHAAEHVESGWRRRRREARLAAKAARAKLD